MDTYHWAALGMCAPAIRGSQFVAERVHKIGGVPGWLGGGDEDHRWILPTRKLDSLLTSIGKSPEVCMCCMSEGFIENSLFAGKSRPE